jgi:aspartyl-tRNA(Asn)/glutamyl-tRNA(Gln) amidotransferase subunit C
VDKRTSVINTKMDKPTVLKVAKLARIKLCADKIDHYVTELTNIMNVIEGLKTADTKGLEPLVNVSEFELPTRKDIVTDGNHSEEILKNAPQKKFGYFSVPKIIK